LGFVQMGFRVLPRRVAVVESPGAITAHPLIATSQIRLLTRAALYASAGPVGALRRSYWHRLEPVRAPATPVFHTHYLARGAVIKANVGQTSCPESFPRGLKR
jgi:hypothetical protein